MNLKKVFQIYNTIKYLKWSQIKFQLYYRFRAILYKVPTPINQKLDELPVWKPIVYNIDSYKDSKFCFLNIEHNFNEQISWNYGQYGKLWVYNLNYFEFLNSRQCSIEDGYYLIKDYCRQYKSLKDGLEPYPISLRVINWVKFLALHQINDPIINGVIVNDLQILREHLEFHILANHLLENIFALYIGSVFLNDKVLRKDSCNLLKKELNEQILEDGAHYEQSPMYHQIILYRLLDVIHLNDLNNIDTDQFLILKVKKMLSWLEKISFSNGDIPYVNDATSGIAPTTIQLLDYAEKLGIMYNLKPLSDSGYRKVNGANYEVVVDVGNITSSYQPGHLHSDALQFILYHNKKPLFVDTGISTYEKNVKRNVERSANSHNTVVVGEQNPYDVWGGFRVGKRSKVKIIKEIADNSIEAKIFNYFGSQHNRLYNFHKNRIEIFDTVVTNSKKLSKAHFHLHNSREISYDKIKDTFVIDDEISICFENAVSVDLEKYDLSEGFNKTVSASKIVVTFTDHLNTFIDL